MGNTHFTSDVVKYVVLIFTFLVLVFASVYAFAETYGIAGFGRSEYDMKAFQQVTVDNTEQNQAQAFSVGIGHRFDGKLKAFAVELKYEDFGDMSNYGRYAAERDAPGGGHYLDYNSTIMASGSGYAKGISLTGLFYAAELLPDMFAFARPCFVRYGVIVSKSKYSVTFQPRSDGNGGFIANGPHWDESYIDNDMTFGVGCDTKNFRVEVAKSHIMPHSNAAFDTVSTVRMEFKF